MKNTFLTQKKIKDLRLMESFIFSGKNEIFGKSGLRKNNNLVGFFDADHKFDFANENTLVFTFENYTQFLTK